MKKANKNHGRLITRTIEQIESAKLQKRNASVSRLSPHCLMTRSTPAIFRKGPGQMGEGA